MHLHCREEIDRLAWVAVLPPEDVALAYQCYMEALNVTNDLATKLAGFREVADLCAQLAVREQAHYQARS